MNDKIRQNGQGVSINKKRANTAKECAYLAVFVSLVIAAQLAFAVVPGVEVVTVLFAAYAYTFGGKRGVLAATAFSLLRQFVFGVYPNVLALYLIYYNLLALAFGALGKNGKPIKKFPVGVVWLACLCTVCFTLLDNVITALWLDFSPRAARVYFFASLPVAVSQTVCAAVTVGLLFAPLTKAFSIIKKGL